MDHGVAAGFLLIFRCHKNVLSILVPNVSATLGAPAGVSAGQLAPADGTGVGPFRMPRIDSPCQGFQTFHFCFHLVVVLGFKHELPRRLLCPYLHRLLLFLLLAGNYIERFGKDVEYDLDPIVFQLLQYLVNLVVLDSVRGIHGIYSKAFDESIERASLKSVGNRLRRSAFSG